MTEELDPQQLRQELLSLEALLEKTQARSQTLTSERNSLKRRLAAAEKKLEKLESLQAEAQDAFTAAGTQAEERAAAAELRASSADEENEKLSKQIGALIKENRRLAELVDTTSADLEQYRKVALGLDDAVAKARAQTEAKVRTERARVEAKLLANQRNLEAQVADLDRQVKEQGKVLLMPPERVAKLVNGLVEQLRGGLPGLKLGSGELKLKIGFGGVGEHTGFVLPTPDSGPEIKDSLHEVVFRFDRVPGAPLESEPPK